MAVLIIYVVLVAIFEVIVFMIGTAVDAIVPAGWNIIIAMVMFFGVLWLVWPIAVFITERWVPGSKDSVGAQHSR